MEFALIAPVMIALYLGSIEATAGLDVNKNLGRATSMVADLVTQQQTITTDSASGISWISATATLALQVRHTADHHNCHQHLCGGLANSRLVEAKGELASIQRLMRLGSNVVLDPNLLIPGTTVIRVEMKIAYVPLMAFNYEGAVDDGQLATRRSE